MEKAWRAAKNPVPPASCCAAAVFRLTTRNSTRQDAFQNPRSEESTWMPLNILTFGRTDQDEMGLFCWQDGNAAGGNRLSDPAASGSGAGRGSRQGQAGDQGCRLG